MTKLFVRIAEKRKVEQFYRAGIKFGHDWSEHDVDDDAAKVLRAEPMLEVRDTDPNATPDKAKPLPTFKELVADAAAALLGKKQPAPPELPVASELPVPTVTPLPKLPDLPEEPPEDPVPVVASESVVTQADQAAPQVDVAAKPKKGGK